MRQLTPHLAVFPGHINVGVLRDGERALLIDFGDGSVLPALREAGVAQVESILFTHHHRDQACGAGAVTARMLAPVAERRWFEDVASFWNDPAYRWHLYSQHPHHLMLAESLPVDGVLQDGDTLEWGAARITALATPGHTDGSLTYLVEVDGVTVAFTGDLLYDAGQLWELYSLQKGITTTDYHGYLGARGELEASLQKVLTTGASMLVPSHGRVMTDPAAAIAALRARLAACYDNYAAISAARFYFPEIFTAYADRDDVMPIRPGTPPPACLRHDGTTWTLLSETGAAFVMDCGSDAVVRNLQVMLAAGEINAVEGLWITHYHDDHVDGIPAFQAAFDCPCIADASVAQVIADPPAWRLPCTSPAVARVDRWTTDGESWQWREFTMTAYHFPGQSLYHGGLLVEGQGLRMFFAGDSHTPAGIDDYCAQNRNFLGAGVGLDRCVALLQQLKPDAIFNPHVDVAFTFTDAECAFMRANLAAREQLFGALFPWDHANYGMDEWWVRCHPYELHAAPGATVRLELVVTNHSAETRHAACHPAPPHGWHGAGAEADIPEKSEGRLEFTLTLPADAVPGRYAVPVSLVYGDLSLPQCTEAVVCVEER